MNDSLTEPYVTVNHILYNLCFTSCINSSSMQQELMGFISLQILLILSDSCNGMDTVVHAQVIYC
jgi:hypothetical protein